MSTVLAIAPHPDDETLGCGGTLAKYIQAGDQVHWLIVTQMTPGGSWSSERISEREDEIAAVAQHYGFSGVTKLKHPASRLDEVGLSNLVRDIGDAIGKIEPEIVFVPHGGDVHSDHRCVFEATASALKWFRRPGVRRILSYETLSETDAALAAGWMPFIPNVFVDVEEFVDVKLAAMDLYKGEMGSFPFPRSTEAAMAQLKMRGAACGANAAEAFQLLREFA